MSFITLSGSSYLTPTSTTPARFFILCLLHIFESQSAPFLPIPRITLLEYSSVSWDWLEELEGSITTPETLLFSTIKSLTLVSNIISTLLANI